MQVTYKFNRPDLNQRSIIAALEQIGCQVYVVPRGPFDFVVGRHGVNYLLEVKNPNVPKGDRQLTPAQVKFHAEWPGQVAVVSTVDEAIKAVTGQKL